MKATPADNKSFASHPSSRAPQVLAYLIEWNLMPMQIEKQLKDPHTTCSVLTRWHFQLRRREDTLHKLVMA